MYGDAHAHQGGDPVKANSSLRRGTEFKWRGRCGLTDDQRVMQNAHCAFDVSISFFMDQDQAMVLRIEGPQRNLQTPHSATELILIGHKRAHVILLDCSK